MSHPRLELFYYDSCPFCQIVLEVIDDLSLAVEMRDITKSKEQLNRLVSDTGRRTVPCMYIDNKPMFESQDIIRWLKQNKDQLQKR